MARGARCLDRSDLDRYISRNVGMLRCLVSYQVSSPIQAKFPSTEKHKLNLRQQVHPSLRRSLSRVITQVDYRIGDSVHFDRGRLEFDNLALLHFLDQLQHLLAMGSSHLSSTRGMAITVVADERSRDWQPDAAVRSGSQNGVNSANLLGEELMW